MYLWSQGKESVRFGSRYNSQVSMMEIGQKCYKKTFSFNLCFLFASSVFFVAIQLPAISQHVNSYLGESLLCIALPLW